ncbi:MAG: NADH-quinone oxidoreductase, chain, partial [Actinomycetia bacterium]|nr:NADH-quinone oxidoreductase, chain [Actinomycetes bacterium]
AGAGTIVAVDVFLNGSSRQADVVQPVLMAGERPGTTTHIEGRVTRLNPKVSGPGTARQVWMVAAELAARLGGDVGFDTFDGLQSELASAVPSYAAIAGRLDLDGFLAGREDDHQEAPPSMSQNDSPEIHAAAEQGPSGIEATSRNPDAPDPSAGSGESPLPEPAQNEPVLLQPPVQVVFRGGAAASAPPAVDSYSLRLVASRKLYDEGVLVQQASSLAPLAPGTGVAVNPADLDRLGIAVGNTVRVSSSRGALSLAVESNSGVPRGVAVIRGNQPGPDAFDLIDAATAVTDVRIERP